MRVPKAAGAMARSATISKARGMTGIRSASPSAVAMTGRDRYGSASGSPMGA
ncbi:hypothetical protein R3J22_05955 [Trueperella bernardiae]|nr:hypothetical protein [Trueperella bernardiae]